MAVSLLLKTFITRWQSLWYSKHSSQNGGLSATKNIQNRAVSLILKTFIIRWQYLCYSYHSKMAVSQLLETCTRWQPLCYSKYAQDGSPFDTTYKIRQSFCYSKHSLQNGSLSATQNIHHKMAVFLLLKTFITKWQSLCYSKHSSQNGSIPATQNTHKMAVSLLLKTIIRWRYLCYSEHSCLMFLNGYRRRFSIVLKFECANKAKTSRHQVSS
jgi:hypothetical protein